MWCSSATLGSGPSSQDNETWTVPCHKAIAQEAKAALALAREAQTLANGDHLRIEFTKGTCPVTAGSETSSVGWDAQGSGRAEGQTDVSKSDHILPFSLYPYLPAIERRTPIGASGSPRLQSYQPHVYLKTREKLLCVFTGCIWNKWNKYKNTRISL